MVLFNGKFCSNMVLILSKLWRGDNWHMFALCWCACKYFLIIRWPDFELRQYLFSVGPTFSGILAKRAPEFWILWADKVNTIATLKANSWGRHGTHLGPTGPRWAPCWPHEFCYLGTDASDDMILTVNHGWLLTFLVEIYIRGLFYWQSIHAIMAWIMLPSDKCYHPSMH